MFVHNNVEVAGEVESRLAEKRVKYNTRVKQQTASKNKYPPISKGVLIF